MGFDSISRSIIYSIVLCFFAMGVETIGANKAASFINVVPIFGILSSWLWIGEELGLVQIVSFISNLLWC